MCIVKALKSPASWAPSHHVHLATISSFSVTESDFASAVSTTYCVTNNCASYNPHLHLIFACLTILKKPNKTKEQQTHRNGRIRAQRTSMGPVDLSTQTGARRLSVQSQVLVNNFLCLNVQSEDSCGVYSFTDSRVPACTCVRDANEV